MVRPIAEGAVQYKPLAVGAVQCRLLLQDQEAQMDDHRFKGTLSNLPMASQP